MLMTHSAFAPGTWTTLINEPQASAQIQAAIASIANALVNSDLVRLYGPSLADGSAGVAVLFDYLQAAASNQDWADSASLWLSHAVATTAAHEFTPALFGGTTGVAWVLHRIASDRRSRGMDLTPDRARTPSDQDLRLNVDRNLLVRCNQDNEHHHDRYDLVGGLVGYGLYALECLERPGGRVLLQKVVDRLSQASMNTPDGLTWRTAPRLIPDSERGAYPDGMFNLGIAHGVPGVIVLLAQVCAAGVAINKARALLDGAVRWLLAQRNPEGCESCFPTQIAVGAARGKRDTSRVAWCYGDLGVSAALYQAALQVKDEQWAAQALDIARHVARRPFDEFNDRDACLCHGAAGNGHIFNRLYQGTREPLFRDAALRWFERAMSYYRPGRGVGGFAGWWGKSDPDRSAWRYVPGMLRGAAGVGLALAAATSRIEPTWDRMFAVSIPPVAG